MLAKENRLQVSRSERGTRHRSLPYGRERTGEAVENVALEIGVSPRTYYRASPSSKGSRRMIKRKLREGKIEINTACGPAIRRSESNSSPSPATRCPIPPKFCAETTESLWSQHIEEGTADIVFTDPQYGMKGLGRIRLGPSNLEDIRQMWSELGDFSSKVLKEGGYLSRIYKARFPYLAETCLRQYISTTTGESQSNSDRISLSSSTRSIRNRCKQILIFAKGKGRDHEWLFDLLRGAGKGNKDAHEWAQPQSEAAYLINKLTKPNELVVEPHVRNRQHTQGCGQSTPQSDRIRTRPESYKVAQRRISNLGAFVPRCP